MNLQVQDRMVNERELQDRLAYAASSNEALHDHHSTSVSNQCHLSASIQCPRFWRLGD